VRDIELWQRLLAARESTTIEQPERVAELLRSLRALKPARRGAFFALMRPRIQDDDPRVRAAAVAALAGVRGIDGLRAVVAALDDEHADVRAASLDALRVTARDEPHRWAHAIFHPRLDVRERALRDPAAGDAAQLSVYLRADPSLALHTAHVPWPRHSLPLVLDFHLRGLLDPADARERITAVSKAELTKLFASAAPKRSRKLVMAVLERGSRGKSLGLAGADTMDVVLDMTGDQLGPLHRVAEALDRPMLRRRFAVSVLARAARHGWEPNALALAGASEPRVIGMPAIPLAQRRLAARGLGLHPSLATADDDLALNLLSTVPLAHRDADGEHEVDLVAAACIAGRLSECRLPLLSDALGPGGLLDAIVDGPLTGWAAVCRIPREDRKVTTDTLLSEVRARSETRWQECVAVALLTWASGTKPKRSSRFGVKLLSLDGAETREVLAAAERLVRTGEISVSAKRSRVFADSAAAHLERSLRAGLFSETLRECSEPVSPLSRAVLEQLGRRLRSGSIASVVRSAELAQLTLLCSLIDEGLSLQRDREKELFKSLDKLGDPGISAWVASRSGGSMAPPGAVGPRPIVREIHELSEAEVDTIATATGADLETALGPALDAPSRRLAEALSRRPEPGASHLGACVALMGSYDPVEELMPQLARFAAADDEFLETLERACVTMWQGNEGIPPLGQALLYRWEEHGLAWAEWVMARPGGPTRLLGEAMDYHWPRATWIVWRAAASMALIWRAREPARLDDLATDAFIDLCVDQLDSDVGPFAARVLVQFHLGGSSPSRLRARRERVLERGPDMSDETRRELERWIEIDGVPRRGGPGRRLSRRLAWAEKRRIRRSTDVPALEGMLTNDNPNVVKEAAGRLVALDLEGQRALARALTATDLEPVHPTLITETIARWTDEPALAQVRAMARNAEWPAMLRFRVALALASTGDGSLLETALEAACAAGESWFRREDWDVLCKHGDALALARTLALSPHPHAYRPAVKLILDRGPSAPEDGDALRQFLDGGTLRARDLRRRVTRALLAAGDAYGLVVALGEVLGGEEPAGWLFDALSAEDAVRALESVLEAMFVGGVPVCGEARAHGLLKAIRIPTEARREALRRLLTDGRDPKVREELVARLPPSHLRAEKIDRLAEIFAWGIRRGRELTGKLFRVHMTHRVQDFGYTRMRENRIFVTPLPVLRGDRHGEDIVEALILHEFGHHMYHHGRDAEAVWRRAQTEGLFPLLNLVADEHLERNIRALEPEYGDRLKRLASFAFAHSEREVKLSQLLETLRAGSFDALSSHAMAVAHDPDAVIVHRGRLLRELERSGQPFARFVRALRMGLGNRDGDPLLEQALALFDRRFRHHDMDGLYRVALRLAELYGGAGELAKMFGGHESLEWGERDSAIHGDGIRDDEVQREVERILDPGRRKESKTPPKGPGRLQINVGDGEHFDEITSVVPVDADDAERREAARQVRRHADRLRSYLESLGLALVPRRARMRGRAFDRTRTRAVVLRGDPRMLVAREVEVHSDLFIGVVIDCSGSMGVGDCMPKAHRFGTLIAEAVQPLRGVDARFFGFTDTVIYDAGDDRRCSVTALAPGGGNNDAAALMHAARVAMASRRKAKVLVMISDGLPTECSVASLRGLVQQLSRRHNMCCAQVAVRPIEEVCFPHYVELDTDSLDVSTRKFGEIVSNLARRAMGR
jgi:hypothetical protein